MTDHELGEVPVRLPQTRARAWLTADADERRRAAAMAQFPFDGLGEAGWGMEKGQHGLRRAVVTELLQFATANADQSSEARTLVEMWEQGPSATSSRVLRRARRSLTKRRASPAIAGDRQDQP